MNYAFVLPLLLIVVRAAEHEHHHHHHHHHHNKEEKNALAGGDEIDEKAKAGAAEMNAAAGHSSENSVEKAEMSEESGKAEEEHAESEMAESGEKADDSHAESGMSKSEEKSDEFQEKSEMNGLGGKADKFNAESEMKKEDSGKEVSSSGDVPMKESEKDAEQNSGAESKSGGSGQAPVSSGSGQAPVSSGNNNEKSNIDSGGSSSDMPQEDAGTAEKQADNGRRKALMADNLMRQAEMEADEDESAIRDEDEARKKSIEEESEEARDNAAKAEEWKKDYVAKITRQKQALVAADKAEAEQEKAAADTKGEASSKEKSLSPNVIDEFADIAKDMHDSKTGNTAVSTAADAKPKAKGVDESSPDAAAGDAEAGQAGQENEASGEAAPAGNDDSASKAESGEGGVKQLGRIDRDFRSLHHLLQRLNRRRDRRMQSPLAVGAPAQAALSPPAQAPAARAVVNTLLGSSGGSKKALPALIEADAREDADTEDAEVRADADAAAGGGAAGAEPAKPTWADEVINLMKPEIEKLKADEQGMRAKINEAMQGLINGDCTPSDPVSCFVKALTGKTTRQHYKNNKDANKPTVAQAEPKIAEWLWEHFKYQLLHALSSTKSKDQAAGVELLEELREWADKFGAPLVKANNCTVLPEDLRELWKCVKCTRINGSSIWSLDSTTSYRICIKTTHDSKKEAAHCEKEILELKKNTTLFLNCLHGVSYRAMLATGKLRGFVEKLLKKLAPVVKDLEEDRGNSVYRLLKGRKIGDDGGGKCSKPPAYLSPIDKKCLFCQDKMWIMKDEAKFTTCNVKDSTGFVCGPVCIYTIVSVTIAVILIILIIALVLVPMAKKKRGGGDNANANANANENSNAKKSQLVAKDSRGSYERLAPAAE